MGNSNGLVLFVDDEEINRILAEDILESIGYESILVSSGVEAIKVYSDNINNIDIVILDFMMPEMDGKETFIKLKEINNSVKVVLSTGYSETEDIKLMREMGLSSVIKKPYKIEELKTVLDNVLNI